MKKRLSFYLKKGCRYKSYTQRYLRLSLTRKDLINIFVVVNAVFFSEEWSRRWSLQNNRFRADKKNDKILPIIQVDLMAEVITFSS